MSADPITNQKLKEAFFSLKTNKSAGYDEIGLNVIKNYHTILIRKLEMYGIKGINLAWFRSYLTNRIQYISITHDLETNTKNICCGVPQGSILGPLLFLLYVNDLHNSSALDPMFADDTNLFYNHKDLKNFLLSS